MTRFLALGLSCLFVMALGISEADARRFGGGSSKGTFSRQVSPPPQQQRQQAQQNQSASNQQQASTSRRGGLMGPLMGLAAGGLLAALFFGGAFEGIQFFDILILLLLGAGVFLFLRSRAKASQPAVQGVGQSGQSQADHFSARVQPASPAASGSNEPESPTASDIRYGAPDWFDEAGFLQRAKQHFIDLQAAWDANDFAEMEAFVTPQLYRFLQEERARQPDEVKTKVLKLAAEVSNIQQIGETVELAIMFHGVISESGAPEAPFCEIWHLIRDMSQENAPWLIQGIEQVE